MPFTSVDEPSCGGGARVLFFSAAKGRPTTPTTLCHVEGVVAKIIFRRAGRVALLEKKKKLVVIVDRSIAWSILHFI